MVKELGFGIIGAGYMAKTHSLALRNIGSLLWPSMPRMVLRRMADMSETNALVGASRWGWEESATDWREITRASDIDVVIVITPNDSHAEISIDAFEHNKHVFCENLPFSWRFDQSISGGGAVADLGSHIFDIACALMGGIASVAARSRRIYAERPAVGGTESMLVSVDDLTASLVQFRSGATGAVHASWAATGHKSDLAFSVVGTKGAIEFQWERNNELHFYSNKDDKKTAGFRRIMIGGMHPEAGAFWHAQGQGLGYGEAFVVTARRLIQAIQDGDRNFEPNFAQALHISRVIEATRQAAETNSWVSVNGQDPFAPGPA